MHTIHEGPPPPSIACDASHTVLGAVLEQKLGGWFGVSNISEIIFWVITLNSAQITVPSSVRSKLIAEKILHLAGSPVGLIACYRTRSRSNTPKTGVGGLFVARTLLQSSSHFQLRRLIFTCQFRSIFTQCFDRSHASTSQSKRTFYFSRSKGIMRQHTYLFTFTRFSPLS